LLQWDLFPFSLFSLQCPPFFPPFHCFPTVQAVSNTALANNRLQCRKGLGGFFYPFPPPPSPFLAVFFSRGRAESQISSIAMEHQFSSILSPSFLLFPFGTLSSLLCGGALVQGPEEQGAQFGQTCRRSSPFCVFSLSCPL